MKVLIFADMEGVVGIETREQCSRREPDYASGQHLLEQEVNVVARAARRAGASSVSVIDWHAGGGNMRQDKLDDVQIVAEDFGPGYDVVLMTGYHAMRGTEDAFISHTMSQPVSLQINGQQSGELALISRWAGEEGVPVAFVSGDDATVREASAFLPGVAALSVKKALSWGQADCTPAEQAYADLEEGVKRALSNRQSWHCFKHSSPLDIGLKLDPEPGLMNLIPWLERDADGWFSGSVRDTKRVIDLIDLVTALGRI